MKFGEILRGIVWARISWGVGAIQGPILHFVFPRQYPFKSSFLFRIIVHRVFSFCGTCSEVSTFVLFLIPALLLNWSSKLLPILLVLLFSNIWFSITFVSAHSFSCFLSLFPTSEITALSFQSFMFSYEYMLATHFLYISPYILQIVLYSFHYCYKCFKEVPLWFHF